MFNLENWGTSSYSNENIKAFISLAGALSESENTNIIYAVTVLENDEVEVFQKDFTELTQAIEFTNNRYGHWDFSDQGLKKSGGGCSDCSAH